MSRGGFGERLGRVARDLRFVLGLVSCAFLLAFVLLMDMYQVRRILVCRMVVANIDAMSNMYRVLLT